MTTLRDYLAHKVHALAAFRARTLGPGSTYVPRPLAATVTVEGRSGVRRIRIRDYQIIADSPPEMMGYNLGPTSPELALAALGGCVAHSWLIHAASLGVMLDAVEIEVSATIDSRAGEQGYESSPREPQGIGFLARIVSDAPEADVARVHDAVVRLCPIVNLFRNAQPIAAAYERSQPKAIAA